MSANIHNLYTNGLKRLYFFKVLKNIHVDRFILSLFYKSIVESVIVFGIISWYGSATKRDSTKLNRIVKIAGRSCNVSDLSDIYQAKLHKFACKIVNDDTHPLHHLYTFLPSISMNRRLRSLPCKTAR